MYALTLLERQCCGALSRNKISLWNFLFSCPRYEMKEYWLKDSYCLNNCRQSRVMRACRHNYWTHSFRSPHFPSNQSIMYEYGLVFYYCNCETVRYMRDYFLGLFWNRFFSSFDAVFTNLLLATLTKAPFV